jgi:hypothetical protein
MKQVKGWWRHRTNTPPRKDCEHYKNGTVKVTPDEGYALSKVTAEVNVQATIKALIITENKSHPSFEGCFYNLKFL